MAPVSMYQPYTGFIASPPATYYNSRWIFPIRCWIYEAFIFQWFRSQVTKLDRDPASGTALQEISFWLNLERALQRIQEKRDSLEISLTLEILKHGKRFHATLSFDTDTGRLTV